MNDDQLKKLWHTANGQVTLDEGKLAGRMDMQLQRFERDIRRRDRREIVASAVLIPVFAAMTVVAQPVATKAGAALGTLWAIACIIILKRTSAAKPADTSLPCRAHLVQIAAYTRLQRSLLNSVLWWYVLPFTISCSLMFAGYGRWWELTAVVAMAAFVLWLNKRTVKTYFDPLLRDIELQLQSLGNDDI